MKKSKTYSFKRNEYPFTQDDVPRDEFLAWIKLQVGNYGGNEADRSKVNRAMEEKKEILFEQYQIDVKGETINAPKFFAWAVRYNDWGKRLQDVKNLPRLPVTFNSNSSIDFEPSMSFSVLPSAKEELVELVASLMNELRQISLQNEELKNKNEQLEIENASYKEQEANRKKKQSEAGKKGAEVTWR